MLIFIIKYMKNIVESFTGIFGKVTFMVTVAAALFTGSVFLAPSIASACDSRESQCSISGYKYNHIGEGLVNWIIGIANIIQCAEGDEWADRVVNYTQGVGVIPLDQTSSEEYVGNSWQALGKAEGSDTYNFVSLGINGELVLEFDNVILNGEGNDIEIVETSFNNITCQQYPEKVHVYASRNGNNTDWEDLGTGCLDSTFDLGNLPWAKFIKLVDESDLQGDGYDVDAVKALHCGNYKTVASTTTNAFGEYCFANVATGSYAVYEERQSGWNIISVVIDGISSIFHANSFFDAFIEVEIEDNGTTTVDFYDQENDIPETNEPVVANNIKVVSADVSSWGSSVAVDNADCPNVVVVSNTDDMVVGGNNAVEVWDEYTVWTAVIDMAKWIWNSNEHPTMEETYTFTKNFEIAGIPMDSILNVAADNTYTVWINDTELAVVTDPNNYQIDTQDEYTDITGLLQTGMNTIAFEVTNAQDKDNAFFDAAGLLYKLEVAIEGNSCLNTPPIIFGVNSPLMFHIGKIKTELDLEILARFGIVAIDTEDGNISEDIAIINLGSVSTSTVGTTTIYYDVVDSGLYSAETIKREVIASDVYLSEYIKLGKNNFPIEVEKLEQFLNEFEKENLPVNGIYEQVDYEAVKKFQLKYKEDILNPWNYDEATGYVYITTKKKINELYYQKEFSLTVSQEAEIAAFNEFMDDLQDTEENVFKNTGVLDVGGVVGTINNKEALTDASSEVGMDGNVRSSELLVSIFSELGFGGNEETGEKVIDILVDNNGAESIVEKDSLNMAVVISSVLDFATSFWFILILIVIVVILFFRIRGAEREE